ncbi:MAG TPA: MinD/ParA family protein [Desulfobacter sp.]|nr:MinD/ParA family protein [Desulfobacter sp.]
MTKLITIASGKGGAGKTSISLNLALALADANYRVCLFDADLGLANVNILTGFYPQYGLAQVMEGSHTLSDIMIRNFNGIDIIPGSSGVEKLADLTSQEAGLLIQSFLELPDYDYFLIDTSAGISAQVLSFCRACQEMILVVTPEPTSLTDAYSLLKVLSKKGAMPKIRVVVNRVRTAQEAKASYAKLKKTVFNFLSTRISPLGIVARDPSVSNAVVSQVPFFLKYPDTQATRCIRALMLKLVKDPGKEMSLEAFWDQCLDILGKKPPRIRESLAIDSGQKNDGLNDLNSDSEIQSAHTVAPTALIPRGREEESTARRLDGIEEKLSQLLQEVADLKHLLKAHPKKPATKSKVMETAPSDHHQIVEPEAPEHFILDFETWLAEQEKSKAQGFSTV